MIVARPMNDGKYKYLVNFNFNLGRKYGGYAYNNPLTFSIDL